MNYQIGNRLYWAVDFYDALLQSIWWLDSYLSDLVFGYSPVEQVPEDHLDLETALVEVVRGHWQNIAFILGLCIEGDGGKADWKKGDRPWEVDAHCDACHRRAHEESLAYDLWCERVEAAEYYSYCGRSCYGNCDICRENEALERGYLEVSREVRDDEDLPF